MKKLTTLLVIIFSFIFITCSKDKENDLSNEIINVNKINDKVENQILWKKTYLNEHIKYKVKIDGTKDNSGILAFNENGVFITYTIGKNKTTYSLLDYFIELNGLERDDVEVATNTIYNINFKEGQLTIAFLVKNKKENRNHLVVFNIHPDEIMKYLQKEKTETFEFVNESNTKDEADVNDFYFMPELIGYLYKDGSYGIFNENKKNILALKVENNEKIILMYEDNSTEIFRVKRPGGIYGDYLTLLVKDK